MKLFTFFVIILGILVTVFGFTPTLRQYVLDMSFHIKIFYLDKKEDITFFIQDYINQANQIQNMRTKIQNLEAETIQYEALKAEFENLSYSLEVERHYDDPDVHLAKILSYATLGSYTKIWIRYPALPNNTKILGIIKDGYAIGIAKWVDNHLLGILIGDPECSYSVYIGENHVPGTLRTIEDGSIVIDYIPAWQSIKSGDSVITSGLDGIFFEDIKVGTIGAIKSDNGYLRAELKLQNFNNHLSYVWLVDTKIMQTTTLNDNIQNIQTEKEK
ncbi:rod shape-determining protein MreC [Helicobacter didelphidarum]|uniref:Rod shape-determining protein MreC n=1 Tax=Helicobacter didelphidarum TaxID=2040648 RepID=A0A3D8IJH6_9HELI|nr:rod shape-determining protein MreC [Helicobacter didelphidarum]RDU65392.1 rod shape-determining protein MreC [Helicobacter didelphidarum]